MAAHDHATMTGGVGAVGLGEVLRGILLRRKKLVLFTTLLFAALGYMFITMASPVYTASSRVLIDYEETPYIHTGIAANSPAQRQITERDVRSQVEVLKSRDLALAVLRKLNLLETPEFDPLKRRRGFLSRLKVRLGFSPDPATQTPEQRALATWYRHLKVYSLPNTKVVIVEYSASSPALAARIVNTLAETYVAQTRDTRLNRTGEAREWLKQQIDKLRQKVVEAERRVERYRAKAGLFQGTQSKLHNQELSELSAQIVRAAAQRSQAEAQAKAIREMLKRGVVDRSSEVLRSQLIQRLREQQVLLKRRLAELRTTYLDNHPRVRAVRRELADLKRQINAEARKIAQSLEQQARIAAEREAELRQRLEELKKKVSSASLEEVKLRELEREAKAQRSLLESFLARYTDASTRDQEQALPGMARIIERAGVPAVPSFPKKGPIMVLAVLGGLMLGLGTAFVLEVMAAVRAAEEAAMECSAAGRAPEMERPSPSMASVAQDDTSEPAPAMPEATMPEATMPERAASAVRASADEAARSRHDDVATLLARWHEEHGARKLAVAPLGLEDEEAADMLLAAARRLGSDRRVILLDAEGLKGAMARRYPGKGLADFLKGEAGFAEVVHADKQARHLHVVAAGTRADMPDDLHTPLMKQLLEALEENYDIVLLWEGMPRFPLQSRGSLLPLADGVAVVHAPGMAGAADSLRAALAGEGMRLAGLVQATPGRAASEATTQQGGLAHA